MFSIGSQSTITVPPSWIVKLPRRGSFKSSLRKSPKKKSASKKKGKDSKNEQKTFVIKPIPTASVKPVLVFINPKSGGNQGAKLLQKFQWLLNPRQVFDLTQGGPGPGYVLILHPYLNMTLLSHIDSYLMRLKPFSWMSNKQNFPLCNTYLN